MDCGSTFLIRYCGFLVDGQLYREILRNGENFYLDLAHPWARAEDYDPKALTSDVRVSTPNGGAESAVAVGRDLVHRVIFQFGCGGDRRGGPVCAPFPNVPECP